MKTTVGTCAAAVAITALAAPAGAWWIKDCGYVTSFDGQTAMVADINPGPSDAVNNPFGWARNELMGVYQGKLYFQADDGQSGAELWRVDSGAAAQVEDFVAGAEGSAPHSFVEFQNKLYFAATTPATGEELFRYDGASITLAAETVAGPKGGGVAALTEYKGALYFTRFSVLGGDRVWRLSGGTAQPVAAINASPGHVDDSSVLKSPFVVFGGRLYYVLVTLPGTHSELWAYDGSAAQKIKTLASWDGYPYGYTPFDVGVYQQALYFGVVDLEEGKPVKGQLWRYTGQGGPAKVATFDYVDSFSQPRDFQTYKGKLYFSAARKLHRFDGSGVQELSTVPSAPEQLSLFSKADRLYLTGFYGDFKSREAYTFDGATADLLKNIMPDTASPVTGSFPTSAVETADAFYFYASDEDHGRELWQVTGTVTSKFKCDVVVAPIWVNKHLWVIDKPEVVVATWLVDPEAGPRLLSREVVRVERKKEVRVRVLEQDTRRQPLPEAFALATIVFDRATGAPLDQGFDFIGEPSPRAAAALRRAAAGVLAKPSLKDLMSEPVRP